MMTNVCSCWSLGTTPTGTDTPLPPQFSVIQTEAFTFQRSYTQRLLVVRHRFPGVSWVLAMALLDPVQVSGMNRQLELSVSRGIQWGIDGRVSAPFSWDFYQSSARSCWGRWPLLPGSFRAICIDNIWASFSAAQRNENGEDRAACVTGEFQCGPTSEPSFSLSWAVSLKLCFFLRVNCGGTYYLWLDIKFSLKIISPYEIPMSLG